MKVLLNIGGVKSSRREHKQKLDDKLQRHPEGCAGHLAYLQELLHLFLQTDHGLLLWLLGGKYSQNEFFLSHLSFSQEAGNTYRFGHGGIVVIARSELHHWETVGRSLHLDWSNFTVENKSKKDNQGSDSSVKLPQEGHDVTQKTQKTNIRLEHSTNSESEVKSTQIKFLRGNSYFPFPTSSFLEPPPV